MGSRSSTSSVLLILLLVFTLPIWIGIAGGLFGLIAGLCGAAIGIVAGIFGALVGILGWVFDWNFHTHWPFAVFGSGFFITMAIVLIVVLITRSRKI